MTAPGPGKDQRQQPSWDALMEDVLGLSIRGLVTIKDLFIRPAAVIEASRHHDWQERYTPSIRLLFSIVAVIMLLSYFWAGEISPNYQFVLQNYEQAKANNPNIPDPRELADQFFAYWSLCFPIFYIAVHSAGAWALRIWGRRATFTERIRQHFACIIPAMTLSVLGLLIMPLVPVERIFDYSMLTVMLGAFVTLIVFIRAKVPEYAWMGRTWRGAVFAAMVFLLDLTASVLTGTTASYLTVQLALGGNTFGL